MIEEPLRCVARTCALKGVELQDVLTVSGRFVSGWIGAWLFRSRNGPERLFPFPGSFTDAASGAAGQDTERHVAFKSRIWVPVFAQMTAVMTMSSEKDKRDVRRD